MRKDDIPEFSGMLDSVCSLLSRGTYTPTAPNTALWFRALSGHDLDEVRAGFDAHVKDSQRGRFVPTPADILAQIEGIAADDGRPGTEEAWAIVLRGADESQTIVWTEEAAQAWAMVAPILNGGDQVGARMAFKETYSRMVDEARRAQRRPMWSASLGHDPAGHQAALEQAALLGRLPAPDLLALASPEEALAVLAAAAPEAVREKLLGLRARIANKSTGPSADQLAHDQTKLLKSKSAEQFAAYRGEAA